MSLSSLQLPLYTIKTFARRIGRPLNAQHKMLLQHHLPKVEAISNITIKQQHYKKINLEIGFGTGDNIIYQAQQHTDALYIGCEPFINGVVKVLSKIAAQNLNNILLHADDVRILLDNMQHIQFDEIFILFPDPWPKKRHHKKRLINTDFLHKLAIHHMRSNTKLYISTDHKDYAQWILEEANNCKAIKLLNVDKKAWETPLFPHIESKYEARGKSLDNDIVHFAFVKAAF